METFDKSLEVLVFLFNLSAGFFVVCLLVGYSSEIAAFVKKLTRGRKAFRKSNKNTFKN